VAAGEMSGDYRHGWLRDVAFTISALLDAGCKAEAEAWRDWILRAIAGSPQHIQVMYRLDGARDLNGWNVPWLSGYRRSAPVRVGNAAAHQRQIDVFGELVEVMDLAAEAGIGRDASDLLKRLAALRTVRCIAKSAAKASTAGSAPSSSSTAAARSAPRCCSFRSLASCRSVIRHHSILAILAFLRRAPTAGTTRTWVSLVG
jgi:hypothetical protein